MKQPDTLNQVAEFHNTFKHPILSEPTIPSEDRVQLRIDLLLEEMEELVKAALIQKDIVEVADAFADLQYVLAGAILEFGLGEKFAQIFNEVQRSNMSKACASQQEAALTVEHYEQQGTQAYYLKAGDNQWLVYRKGDNKTLKSVNYSPVDLKRIIDAK